MEFLNREARIACGPVDGTPDLSSSSATRDAQVRSRGNRKESARTFISSVACYCSWAHCGICDPLLDTYSFIETIIQKWKRWMVNFPIIETMRFYFWKRKIHCKIFDKLRIDRQNFAPGECHQSNALISIHNPNVEVKIQY